MTPAKLKRKTKNRLLSYAKGFDEMSRTRPDFLDALHDFAMRAYSEGYTHGEAAERESREKGVPNA